MHGQTHAIVGAAISTLVCGDGWIATVAGTVGALLPDVDLKLPLLRHRGISHTVWVSAAIAVSAFFVDIPLAREALLAASVGHGSHIATDAMTVSGVRPFQPLWNIRLRGIIKTKGRVPPFFLRGKKSYSLRGLSWVMGDWDILETIFAAFSILLLLYSLLLLQ